MSLLQVPVMAIVFYYERGRIMMKLRMRKGMAMLVALCMLIMMIPASVFATSTFAPADITGHWAETKIQNWIDQGLIDGYPDGTFKPGQNIKRAEFMKLVNGAYGYIETTTIDYTDVPLDSWYYNEVCKAEAAGYIEGNGDGRMLPEDPISREEVAKVISIVEGLTSDATAISNYTDKTFISDWAEGYVGAVTTAGIMEGYPDGSFMPKGNITRAESVFGLDNALKYVAPVVALAVTSVSAINATQLQVVFNKAIDKATVIDATLADGTLVTDAVTVTPVGSATATTLTGVLSADGKTLTLTNATIWTAGRNVVVVNNTVKDTTGAAITKYDEILTIVADTTAPTIVSTTKLSATTFKVTFSEPMNALGVTYKLANGTVPIVSSPLIAGNNEVVFTLTSGVVAGDVVTATFVGASDKAGNLLTPNPATTTFTMGSKDGVIPTIASITQTGAKTFDVKFSEELNAAPTITIAGVNLTPVKSTTDATVYNVTGTNVLDGLTTVTFGIFTDLSGETTEVQSKVVIFTKDTVAPKVVSSAIVADATTGKQFIELTFDKDVTLTGATIDGSETTGSYVKDFVTTPITSLTDSSLAYRVDTDKKVVRAQLSTLLGATDEANASYTLALNLDGITSLTGVVVVNPTNVTFTRVVDGSGANTTVLAQPTSIIQGADNNKVNVVFPAAVDGASAINIANYSIGGATIESVSLQPVAAGTTQTAVLNLVSGSNAFTGVRTISVANVKASGSTVTMVAYSTTVSLKENVLPTLSSAKVTSVTQAVTGVAAVTAVTAAPASNTTVAVGTSNVATGTLVLGGTYTGITNKTITLTSTATGYSFAGSTGADEVLATGVATSEGVTFDTTGLTGTLTLGDTWATTVTAAIAGVTGVTAVTADPGVTTVVVTYSEPVNVPSGVTYTVNVGGTPVSGTTAAVTTATNSTTVTIVIDKELTAANFASGVTLTSPDYKVTDIAGNKASIGTTGIVVTL